MNKLISCLMLGLWIGGVIVGGVQTQALAAASDQPIVLRLSHSTPPASPQHKGVFVPWAEELEKRSNGRVKVKIYPSEQLGKASEAYDLVLRRTADISWVVPSFVIGQFPLDEIFHLPFLIPGGIDDPASGQIRRTLYEKYLGGVVNSHIRGEYLDDPKFWILFEKAEKLGVPIYLHPKQPSPDMIKPYLTYPALANAMWGFAAEASLHAVRLICSGVLDRYPDAKVILGHLGEAIPFWLWRLDNHWEKEGKRSLPAQKKPSHYFKNNSFVTTSGMFWSPALQFVSSVLGVDRILFAADYPFESMKEAVQFMDSAPLSDSEREKIYHLNAEKLLALPH